MTTSVLDRTNPFVVRDEIPMPVAGDQPVNARAARTDAYAIHVTRTLEDTVARLVGLLDGAQVALLTDEVVMALHGGKLLDALDGSGIDVQASVMPAGERSKCLEQAGRAWDWLAASSIGRRDVLLAFGGGVINDTGGWIASGYMRGIPYINVPTTDISPSTAFREPPRGKSFGNEFRHRRPGASVPDGAFLEVDYAANAASLGCAAVDVHDVDGLRAALASARDEPRPSLIACHVEPLHALPGAGAFWDLGVARTSEDEQVRRLARDHLERARLQRSYL